MRYKNIVVCGHGPAAVAIASRCSWFYRGTQGTQVTLLVLCESKLNSKLQILWPDLGETGLDECTLTSNAEYAIPKADIIILCHVSVSYPLFLEKILPLVNNRLQLIMGVPAASAFDWLVQKALRTHRSKEHCFAIGAMETMPFVARRTAEFNKIEIMGYKTVTHLALANPYGASAPDINISIFNELFGTQLHLVPSFLYLTLMNPAAAIHPTLMYVNFRMSNELQPNFYGPTECEQIMNLVQDEQLQLAKALATKTGLDLSIPTLRDLLVMWYPVGYMKDTSSLTQCLASHKIYRRVPAPTQVMTEVAVDSERFPDFNHRYITEDIPNGLICWKGLAELIGMPTPTVDKVIQWCQGKSGKLPQFLDPATAKLNKNNLSATTAPQNFGIILLAQLSSLYQPHTPNFSLESEEFFHLGATFCGQLLPYDYLDEIDRNVSTIVEKTMDAEALLNLHFRLPWVKELISRPELTQAAKAALHVDTIQVFSSLILVKPPHGKVIVPWHQDAAYDWPLEPLDCVTVWLALDDSDMENGAMSLALGGNRCGKLPLKPTPMLADDEYFFSNQLMNSIPEEALKSFHIIQCNLRRGQCSLHHSLLPHKSPPNKTDRRRAAFIVRYCRGDAKLNIFSGMPREQYFKNYKLMML